MRSCFKRVFVPLLYYCCDYQIHVCSSVSPSWLTSRAATRLCRLLPGRAALFVYVECQADLAGETAPHYPTQNPRLAPALAVSVCIPTLNFSCSCLTLKVRVKTFTLGI